MVTSGTSKIFCKLCFVVLSLTLLAGEKTTTGGFEENKLKKLNGLRLITPVLSIVDAKHMAVVRNTIRCQKWAVCRKASMNFSSATRMVAQVR